MRRIKVILAVVVAVATMMALSGPAWAAGLTDTCSGSPVVCLAQKCPTAKPPDVGATLADTPRNQSVECGVYPPSP